MGMFGGLKSKAVDPEFASQLSLGDRARLFAIGLEDPGAAFQMKQQMQIKPAQDAFLADFTKRLAPQYAETQGAGDAVAAGGDYQWSPPVRTADGLNINSADLPALALKAQRLGVPLTQVLDVMKAQQAKMAFTPSNEMYDQNTGKLTGMVAPKVGDGQVLRRGPNGEVSSVDNAPNYTRALMESEAAKTTGQEGAKSAYDLIDVPDGRGGSIKMPRSAYLGMLGQGQAGGVGGMGYTPPAAVLSGDKIRGDAQAQAQVDLPKDLGGAQQTLDLIQKLKTHPGRQFGTGLSGVLPAMPGSATKDFVTLLDQAKGTGFLTAIGALKGTGQITEIEGKKATDAIARMDRTQSEEGFMAALKDYEDVVRSGMARAQQKAGAPSRPSIAPGRAALEAEARRRGLIK